METKSLRAGNWLVLPLLAARLAIAMTVSVKTSAPSTAPLGTPVTWTVVVSGVSASALLYRFQVQGPTGGLRMIVDYGPKASLTWTTINQEGAYQMEVAVFNTVTLEESAVVSGISFSSLVSGTTPVVTGSANPMVFIYSAPPCPLGEQIRVQFQGPTGQAQYTPYQACVAGVSRNFYLAGMLPGTVYQIQHVFDTRRAADGPKINF
jgi:hypothetical protein